MWLPIRQDSLVYVGTEGQAQKDNWHWQDEVSERCFQEVQEWIQASLCSTFFVLPILILSTRENTVAKKKTPKTSEA